jgi:hypothetical protein
MPILKDILKYQYAPLKEIAIVVMHRLYTDSQGKNTNLSNFSQYSPCLYRIVPEYRKGSYFERS